MGLKWLDKVVMKGFIEKIAFQQELAVNIVKPMIVLFILLWVNKALFPYCEKYQERVISSSALWEKNNFSCLITVSPFPPSYFFVNFFATGSGARVGLGH